MRRLADRLGIAIPESKWPALVNGATFAHMQAEAESITPDPGGILKDHKAFFRRGSSGAGAEALTRPELEHYYLRASRLATPDLFEWLHRASRG
jgi:aryl sulfotransferase